MTQYTWRFVKLPTVAVCLGLAVFPLACGGDDDEADGGTAASAETETPTTPPASDPGTAAQGTGGSGAEKRDRAAETRSALHGDRLAPGVEYDEGSDEEAVAKVTDVFYDSLSAGNEDRFCANVSQATKRQMHKQVRGSGGPNIVCEQSFRPLIRAALRKDELDDSVRALILRVQVTGDDAVVTVRFGDDKTRRLRFVEENDDWKYLGPA
jgi:hypothetical protein